MFRIELFTVRDTWALCAAIWILQYTKISILFQTIKLKRTPNAFNSSAFNFILAEAVLCHFLFFMLEFCHNRKFVALLFCEIASSAPSGCHNAVSENGAQMDMLRDTHRQLPNIHQLLCSGHRGRFFPPVIRPFLLQSTPWNSYILFVQVLHSNVHLVLTRRVLGAKKERLWLYLFNHNILIRIYEFPINIGATYFFLLYPFSVH